MTEAAPAPTLARRAFGVGRRLMPFVSLAWGIAGAALMSRSPSRAGLIAAASVLGWVLLVGLAQLHRFEDARLAGKTRLALRAARFGSVTASAWTIQLSLFFAAPFYLFATPGHLEHVAFLVVLGGAALATLWDPLFRALLKRPVTALLMQAIASFCALNVVLPILGLSNRASLWIAAGATALGLPLAGAAMSAERRLRVALIAAAIGLLLPALLAVGGTRVVPAAPLRLVRAQMGTVLEGHDVADPALELSVVPEQLVCATSLWAPRGLKDELFHVWSKDGVSTDRIALKVEGGGARGFHTFSIKKRLGPPHGVWTCAVETASGQLLGERSIRILASATLPAPAPVASTGIDAGEAPDAQ